MLTGLYPWDYDFDSLNDGDIDSMATMVMKARKKNIIPPSHYNNACDDNLDRIVLTALNLDLEFRYRNAAEFLEEIIEETTSVAFKSNDPNLLYY